MAKPGRPREYVAYEGKKFAVEWYYDERGLSQPLEFAESLDELHRVKLAELFKLIGDIGQIRNERKFRNEGDQIYAFKPKPYRFLCFLLQGAEDHCHQRLL